MATAANQQTLIPYDLTPGKLPPTRRGGWKTTRASEKHEATAHKVAAAMALPADEELPEREVPRWSGLIDPSAPTLNVVECIVRQIRKGKVGPRAAASLGILQQTWESWFDQGIEDALAMRETAFSTLVVEVMREEGELEEAILRDARCSRGTDAQARLNLAAVLWKQQYQPSKDPTGKADATKALFDVLAQRMLERGVEAPAGAVPG